jgi:phosphonoacetaldehyde hydrolase
VNRLRAVVLDWAGTVIDFGSQAPVAAMVRAFRLHGIVLTAEEVRHAMGLLKREHIREVLKLPRVAAAWEAAHGAPPSDAVVERLFAEFQPQQLECLERYGDLIPGVVEAVAGMRKRGLKIGSTTGYTRQMLDRILPLAARQGYVPDADVTPDEVGEGRPAPLMCYLNAVRLRAWPLSRCVKIGDTPSDIAEGRNAGMWTIGVAATGNEVGLSLAEWESLPKEERETRLVWARARLREAGAHFVVDSVADCLPVLDEIEALQEPAEPPGLAG